MAAAAMEMGRSRLVGDREIAITRVFDAPRDLVFGAWIDPKAIGEWWGRAALPRRPIRWRCTKAACGSTPCTDRMARTIRTRFATKRWRYRSGLSIQSLEA